jgi:hypothetical protein
MSKPVTPKDMFDMWQKMVNPSAYPLQSFMFPAPDPKEIEKKIAELETVEHWLKANVNMIQLTVRTLRYQLAMLKGGEKAMESFAQSARAGKETAPQEPDPALWAWNLMSQAVKGFGADAEDSTPPAEPARTRPKRRKS